MMPSFILDENVVILAQKGEDDHGNNNLVCSDLVTQIIEICHTIVVDDVLWDKYFDQLNRPANQLPQMGPHLLRILWNALRISNKVRGVGRTSPPFKEERYIPTGSQKDTYIVRLAVESGAILVTTDGPLREGLESSGIQSAYDLQIVSPVEALSNL